MNRRLRVISNSIIQKNIAGSISEWAFNVFALPCSLLARNKFIIIEDGLEFYKIKINGYVLPLFLSKKIGVLALKHVIAEQFYKWNWHYYEINETTVEGGEQVFDCGSAEGLFTLMTYERAGQVFAFEPLDDYHNGLCKTFKDIANVHVVEEALGDRVSQMYLTDGGIASSVSEIKTEKEIRLNTLDNFCLDKNVQINYIKADIEGYEFNMLKGASNAISQFKPKIALTVYHAENNVDAIKNFLRRLVPDYKFKLKGVAEISNHYVMLHAWV